MANTMDSDFREKIKQKVVRLGGGPRIIKEPYLTEAMNTAIRTIAEHKGWTWMKIGPLSLSIPGGLDHMAIPDFVDVFSDLILATDVSEGSGVTLEYVQPEEFSRRKGVYTGGASQDFNEYTIADGAFKFIHKTSGATSLSLIASLSPSQLDNVIPITGVRDAMPKNLDNCLTYGMLMELLGDEAGAKWADKFNAQLNRLGLLDDKSPDKIVMGGQK